MKAARFVRFCDCFNVPLVTFVDVPGFPGHGAGVRRHHQARGEAALCLLRATVPKVTVITRKRTAAPRRHSSKHIRGDINFAYPTAESRHGPDGAVNIIFRSGIGMADDPRRSASASSPTTGRPSPPLQAAELGYIDEVIVPEETRPRLINALEMLQNKRDRNPPKKHGKSRSDGPSSVGC